MVDEPSVTAEIWWGNVNKKLAPENFAVLAGRARAYLQGQDLFVQDLYAGADPAHRIRVRVVTTQAWSALFARNMFIRPAPAELADFQPDYTILHAPQFHADPAIDGVRSTTAIALSFEQKLIVICGTEYAGEIKKSIFTVMNWLLPARGVMPMHCSANIGAEGDVALFFGLSGTGKTTLSADPRRKLIGDDEHCWSDDGVFNIEGGCYAKCINLSRESEPEIWDAIRYGSVLENVIYDEQTRVVDFSSQSITENTRCSYPVEYIPNAKIPCVGGHPKNVIFLTCDAFGVLPPVSKLSPEQAMYHFISGYTAKVAGTEMGVKDPEATFSACFGAAFMVWHPAKYAELLAAQIARHGSQAWLVNTGWSGGGYGVGKRMSLKYTRAILDAIHDGSLAKAATKVDPLFGLHVPTTCNNVPAEILEPRNTWADKAAYDQKAKHLAGLFHKNFAKYADKSSDAIKNAGPKL